MKELFWAFILLANSNLQFEIKDSKDFVTPLFIKSENDSVLIYGKIDIDVFCVIDYHPADDSYSIKKNSYEEFRRDSQLYEEDSPEEQQDDEDVFAFVRKKYSLPWGEISLLQVYHIGEITVKLFYHGDGHGILNTFLTVSYEDNFFIKRYDEDVEFVAVLDNYLLLIIDNYSGITIRKIEIPVVSRNK